MPTEIYRSRESPWPWPLHAILLFFAFFFVLIGVGGWEGADPVSAMLIALVCVGASVFNMLSRRRIEIGNDGIAIGSFRIGWADIEHHRFRELPPVQAGLLVRLTPSARERLGQKSARYRDEHGEPFDFHVHAYGDRIEEWFERIALYSLCDSAERLREIAQQLIDVQRPKLEVRVITRNPWTLAIDAADQSALRGEEIAKALPDDIRWDPAFEGRVMLLVGPRKLANAPGAEEALELLTKEFRGAMAGRPRVEATWAERQG